MREAREVPRTLPMVFPPVWRGRPAWLAAALSARPQAISRLSTLGQSAADFAGDGTTPANAISFLGSGNRLELQAGSTIVGNVVATAGGNDVFALGEQPTPSFDVSQIGASQRISNPPRFALHSKRPAIAPGP